MIAKCVCNNCPGHIEFDESNAGQTVTCPHCGLETVLYVSQGKPSDKAPQRSPATDVKSPKPAPARPAVTPKSNGTKPSQIQKYLIRAALGALLVIVVLGVFNLLKKEQALITGQIFIVTKDRENVTLGDVKIALLDKGETRTYFNSKALEWSNALAIAQANVDQATRNYDVNKSSAQKMQLDDVINAQADLWDKINWPSADDFLPSEIASTTTDSEGRFKLIVPKSYVDSDLILFAKAERQLTSDEKTYWSGKNGMLEDVTFNGRKTAELHWWMVDVHLNGRKTDEYILSNDNKNGGGVCWEFDKGSPIEKYMMDYGVLMGLANNARYTQDFIENLNKGSDNNLPPP